MYVSGQANEKMRQRGKESHPDVLMIIGIIVLIWVLYRVVLRYVCHIVF